MLRSRWAVAGLIGVLVLIGGCSTLRDHPWFSRGRAAPAADCCSNGPPVPLAEGPILDSGPPVVPPPGAELQPPGTNGNLRPVPQQAQPVPAPPASRRTPGLIIDRWKE